MRVALFLAGAMVLATTALPLHAQDEGRLRKALEGKRITLKMDMPASSEGVDVFPGSNRPVDYDKVGKRMKKHGVAIRDAEAARITRVKVKDDLIEVQLNGGGYGTFGDGLGHLLKNQAADSGTAQQMKYQNQRTEKLAGGSRFNLRYPNSVSSDDMTPAAVIHALEEYATFPEGIATVATQVSAVDVRQPPAGGNGNLRKGMSMEEVGQLAGKPISSSAKNQLLTNKYHWQDGILEADFFNGVLVGYRTSSK